MADRREERTADRVDRLAADVLAGRRLKATPSDAADREAIQVATALAGSREGYPRMSPAFRRRLARLVEQGAPPARLNRRAALVAGLGLAVGAAGGVLAERLNGLAGPARRQPAGQQVSGAPATRGIIDPKPELARWADTGLVYADMVEKRPYRVTAGAVGAFVFRRGERVVAMSSVCTHLPCELVWLADKQVLNCPCHNLAFDLDGQPLLTGYLLPALPLVRVRVQDGRVEVQGT